MIIRKVTIAMLLLVTVLVATMAGAAEKKKKTPKPAYTIKSRGMAELERAGRARDILIEKANKEEEAEKRRARHAKEAKWKAERDKLERRRRWAEAKAKAEERKAMLLKVWADFRGIKWASAIADLPAMDLVEKKDNVTFYRRPDDELVIGKAKLESITYGFYTGRFLSVTIEAEGKVNCKALRRALFARYGKGDQESRAINKWSWRPGREAPKHGTMELRYSKQTERSTLIMSYVPGMKKIAADKRKAAKDKVRDKHGQ